MTSEIRPDDQDAVPGEIKVSSTGDVVIGAPTAEAVVTPTEDEPAGVEPSNGKEGKARWP